MTSFTIIEENANRLGRPPPPIRLNVSRIEKMGAAEL